MYAIFCDNSALDSPGLIAHLQSWQQTHRLKTQQFDCNSHQEVRTICENHGGGFNNVVIIGEQKTFEWVIAEIKNINTTAVFSYVPTSNNLLSKRFGIKDYKEGFTVVMQRKIIDLTAISINEQYFLFDYELQTNNAAEFKAQIGLDTKLKLSLTTNKIVLHNRNQELTPHNSVILMEAYWQPKTPDKSDNILKIPSGMLGKNETGRGELQLRLPANKVRIQASSTLMAHLHISLKNPIFVAKDQRAIRVIVKKGQESQIILAPGLK